MLNILCDVIYDNIDKYVYIWRILLSGKSDSFGNESVIAAKGGYVEHFD